MNNKEYDENDVALFVENSEWALGEADRLINEYHTCKTAYGRSRLIPQLEYMFKRLSFERKEIGKLLGYEV
jgi:hypothetical protein